MPLQLLPRCIGDAVTDLAYSFAALYGAVHVVSPLFLLLLLLSQRTAVEMVTLS